MSAERFERYTHVVTSEELHTARHVRHRLLMDPYRPHYHFAIPEGVAFPFDPNGNVFWRGRHHMGYIYQEFGQHYWGHVSSLDLLHWRHHQPYLAPSLDSPETSIFSGNSFLDKGGRRVLCMYYGCGAGVSLAWSDDADLENWHKVKGNPIVPNPADPAKAGYVTADPCGWIHEGVYYAMFGGAVWKSKNLTKWTRCGPFLAHAYPGVDLDEDISCPDFFPMGDKWVMVCLSHRLGARYYVGRWENEQFYPEYHEMITYADSQLFAPESHTDDKGRRIFFAWVLDSRNDVARIPSGWSGMMCLPRVLTLGADNRFLMSPIEELQTLRYNPVAWKNLPLRAGRETTIPFDAVTPNVFELEAELAGDAAELGVKVCCSADGKHEALIGYDREKGTLKIDTTRSGDNQLGDLSITGTFLRKRVESAPMKLGRNEPLRLRVFVDRCMVEVFANGGRLALSRFLCPPPGASGIKLYAKGGPARAKALTVWDIMPTNAH